MALPAPGNPISASMINTEGDRSSSFNAPLSGDNSTPQDGSLIKLYASPNSDVDQSSPHSYSEFYSKTWGGRQLILYQEYYYNNSTYFVSGGDACASSAWASGGNTPGQAYFSGVLGNGTVLYSGTSGTGLAFSASTGSRYISLKTSASSSTVTICNIDSSSAVTNRFVCAAAKPFDMMAYDHTTPDNYSSDTVACNNQPGSNCYQVTMYHTNVTDLPTSGDYIFYDPGRSIPLGLSPDCDDNGGCFYLIYRDYFISLEMNAIGVTDVSVTNGPGEVYVVSSCSP